PSRRNLRMMYLLVLSILLLGCSMGRSDRGCPDDWSICADYCQDAGCDYGFCTGDE
ncbi:hypothetical protein HPB47_004791, partial [Ixodes persulcatus]